MFKVRAHSNQTVFDLSIQYLGSIEGVFDILRLNPGMGFSEYIDPDTDVFIPDTVINKKVVQELNRTGAISISTFSMNPASINQELSILVESVHYTPAVAIDIASECELEITTSSVIVADSIELTLYGSFDGIIWFNAADPVILPAGSKSTIVNYDYVLAKYLRAKLGYLLGAGIEPSTEITNITYNYEKPY